MADEEGGGDVEIGAEIADLLRQLEQHVERYELTIDSLESKYRGKIDDPKEAGVFSGAIEALKIRRDEMMRFRQEYTRDAERGSVNIEALRLEVRKLELEGGDMKSKIVFFMHEEEEEEDAGKKTGKERKWLISKVSVVSDRDSEEDVTKRISHLRRWLSEKPRAECGDDSKEEAEEDDGDEDGDSDLVEQLKDKAPELERNLLILLSLLFIVSKVFPSTRRNSIEEVITRYE